MGTVDHSRPPATRHQAITVDAGPGPGGPACSASSTPTADAAPQTATAVDQHSADLTQCTPLGLPEPVAWKAGMAGSEGAAARQRAAATRLAIWFYLRRRPAWRCSWSMPRTSSTCPAGPKRTGWMRVAGQAERVGHAAALVRAAGSDPRSCGIYTRLRTDLTHDRTRHWAAAGEAAGRRADQGVVGGQHDDTKSVRAMIEALIAGERSPRALADLALGKMKAKRAALIEALTGRFERITPSWPGSCWTRSTP